MHISTKLPVDITAVSVYMAEALLWIPFRLQEELQPKGSLALTFYFQDCIESEGSP